jgi:hypothetical protein
LKSAGLKALERSQQALADLTRGTVLARKGQR